MSDIDLKKVEQLYTDALQEHGTEAKGVGWGSSADHKLRFDKLCEVIDIKDKYFSINDLGCGYGSLYRYLTKKRKIITQYYGYDISEDMLTEAKKLLPTSENIAFSKDAKLSTKADYTITSGIFNVRFEESDAKWQEYILGVLHNMDAFSEKGFSFNLLTSYVDWKDDKLYYAAPCFYFDYCKKTFSKKVSLLHDTHLYEWTMVVKKN
jgi:SAM-dependent methyltransferase